MQRTDFIENNDVRGFLVFFGQCLSHLKVDYITSYKNIKSPDRHFEVTGMEQALNKYAWPATDTLANPNVNIYNWTSTVDFLRRARTSLQYAIDSKDEKATWDAVKKILDWGLTQNRAAKNIIQLENLCKESKTGICAYLKNIQSLLSLASADTSRINAALIPYASSGISKVHSLASTDGLVIFDSRVAATLTECINEYLRRNGIKAIPPALKLFVELQHSKNNPGQRKPSPLSNLANHPGFSRTYKWIECQVRVSWIFEEVLKKNRNIFGSSNLELADRMHCLEAACFMMGAYLEPGPFSGRSFNFGGC
jgi:hypothetical protein